MVKLQPAGPVALRGAGFVLVRKTTKPMPWANFVVFLTDPEKRKRSFHIAWNGERFNTGPEIDALSAREPEVYLKVTTFLEACGGRYVREVRRRRKSRQAPEDPGHGLGCDCYDCQQFRNEGGG